MDNWREWFDWFTLGDWAESGIEWFVATTATVLSLIRDGLSNAYSTLSNALIVPPWWLVTAVGALLVWFAVHSLRGRSWPSWQIGLAAAGVLLVADIALWYVNRTSGFSLLATYEGPYPLLDSERASFLLLFLPPSWVMILLLALLALATRGLVFGVGAAVGLFLVDLMGQWTNAMQTLAMVAVACLVATLVAIPIGILAARSRVVSSVVKPVLDFMQTMPALIYVLIAVFMFRVGVVPGIVATIIFAMPPAIRLTELGIRQVDAEVVEAGHAFGSPPSKILRQIQLPLALPTIMAGVNQVIMLALSMVVLAGFVGAPGLGQQVLAAISRTNLSLGVEAGLSVVILAIYLDRVTAAIGARSTVARLERAA
jgi:glycine betaine/proline transport system permease protein